MKIRLGCVSELPSVGEAREFLCDNKQFCVTNVNGRLSVLDNVCPHRGGPLGGGVIDDGKLICPWHGWQFDPVTGKSLHVPDTEVKVYKLVVDGDDAFVEG